MLQKGEGGGGKSSFTATKEKGGGAVRKSVSPAEGVWSTKSFWVVLTWELGVLAKLKWGAKRVQPFKSGVGGGGEKSVTLS